MPEPDDTAAYKHYRDNFPSAEFLHTHFGESYTMTGNPHRAEIDQDLHTWLRYLFDGVLRGGPKYLLGLLPNPSRVYVFENGVPAPWVDSSLEDRGLMDELSPNAFYTLCQEFICHHRAGALPNGDWWQWQAAGDSIWVEHIPGTIRKPRTLAQMLGK